LNRRGCARAQPVAARKRSGRGPVKGRPDRAERSEPRSGPLTGCGAKLRRFAGVIRRGGSGGKTGRLLLVLRLLGLLAPGEGQRHRLHREVAALDEPFVVLL
jgi:hypothetical protein